MRILDNDLFSEGHITLTYVPMLSLLPRGIMILALLNYWIQDVIKSQLWGD